MKIILIFIFFIKLSVLLPAYSGVGDKYNCKEVTLNTIYADKVSKYEKPDFSFVWASGQKINLDGFLSFWNLPLNWEYDDYLTDGFEGFSSMSELGNGRISFFRRGGDGVFSYYEDSLLLKPQVISIWSAICSKHQ